MRHATLSIVLVLATAIAHAQSPETPPESPPESQLAPPQTPWSGRFGQAQADFDTQATLSLAGQPVPGGAVRISDKQFFLGDINYALDERWTARMAIAAPPTVAVNTGGSLQAFVPPLSGTLGEVKLAPLVLTLTYSPGKFGPVRPYVGAGAHYLKILASHDRDIASLKVSDTWGGVLQAGIDLELNRRWSLFLDVRQLYAKTNARGTVPALGNLPVRADITLDPTIANIGIGYRF